MTHILVIEDELLVRESVAGILKQEGYQVTDMQNGWTGLAAIRKQLPDLVLCDINMPGMSGFEVLRETRKDPVTVDIPFICLTGRSEQEDRRIGMNLGADDYLTKPFTPEDLLSTIRYRLNQRTRELNKQELTLSRLRDNIIYALPHELRTPLTHILGYSEIMRTSAETITPEEIEQMSTSIFQAGDRLHHLIENYLVYAQLELVVSDPENLAKLRDSNLRDAHSIIADVALARAKAYDRQGDLKLELDNSSLKISEHNLIKICNELIDNAFKFSSPGSRVYIRTVRNCSNYAIMIRDRGRGMTNEQVHSIGASMQFDRALYEQQGVGMGFYVAKRLVELHSGKLDIRSRPGRGTCIQFNIPIPA
ncbi:MAG: response regulator [Anaerolineae bacterium]|nr:response regulator [Anaerolineae bacterium]